MGSMSPSEDDDSEPGAEEAGPSGHAAADDSGTAAADAAAPMDAAEPQSAAERETEATRWDEEAAWAVQMAYEDADDEMEEDEDERDAAAPLTPVAAARAAATRRALDKFAAQPLVPGDNSFVLEEDLSPQRASSMARAAGALAARLQVHANLELPAEKFFTIEGMQRETGLTIGSASGDQNNCMLNSAAQSLGLLHPSQAHDPDVLTVLRNWRCHLHARIMPYMQMFKADLAAWVYNTGTGADVPSVAARRIAARIFWKRYFQGVPHLSMLAHFFQRPVVVHQCVGRGTEQPGMDCEPFQGLFFYPPGLKDEKMLSRAEAIRLAHTRHDSSPGPSTLSAPFLNDKFPGPGAAIWLSLKGGHFQPMLYPDQVQPDAVQSKKRMLAQLDMALPAPAGNRGLLGPKPHEGVFAWSAELNQFTSRATRERVWELLKIGSRVWVVQHGLPMEVWVSCIMPRILPYM